MKAFCTRCGRFVVVDRDSADGDMYLSCEHRGHEPDCAGDVTGLSFVEIRGLSRQVAYGERLLREMFRSDAA